MYSQRRVAVRLQGRGVTPMRWIFAAYLFVVIGGLAYFFILGVTNR